MFDIKSYDNSIIICPSDMKEYLISQFKKDPSINVKYLSKNELVEGAYFSYTPDVIYYVSKEYGYSFDNAKEILENMKGIQDGTGVLHNVYQIYCDLFSKYKLTFNPHFSRLFINKKVYIYGYSSFDKEITNSLDKIGVKYEYINENKTSFKHVYYSFDTITDEVTYVFNRIGKLINDGVDLNDIVLLSPPSEYELLLMKQMIYHNIPFENNSSSSLYDSPIFKRFIELLTTNEIEEAFNIVKEEYADDDTNSLRGIVNLDSKIVDLNLSKSEYISFVSYLSKSVHLKKKRFEHAIRICSTASNIIGKYCFILGFSLGQYPKISKDNDFYSDEEKKILNINTSNEINEMRKEELKNFILNNENVFITFKNKIGKSVYYPSPLIKELGLEEVKDKIDNVRYSLVASQLEVGKLKDQNKNFMIDSPLVNSFSDEELEYMSFDGKFKPSEKFKDDGEIRLSYSSIDSYVKCPFMYFIKKKLNASVFETSFNANLGTYLHKILETSLEKEVSLEDFKEDFDTMFIEPKDRFFAHLAEPQILKVIQKNQQFKESSSLKTCKGETPLSFKIDENTSLFGYVDKIMMDEDDKLVSIVDYKAYKMSFNKENVNYGFSLQLPIYALLLKENMPDYKICGLYYQTILCAEPDNIKKKPYYLDGITLADENIIKKIDSTYVNSNFIKGLKTKKSGELAISKNNLITQSTLDEVIEETINQIKKSVEGIREGKFDIHVTDDGKLPCEFCNCQDICYMNVEEDVVTLSSLKKQDKEAKEEE